MAIADNESLFLDRGMRRRYETVCEFLAAEGEQCGITKDYLIRVLHHIGEAVHMSTANGDLWKAYVILDVLIDRWDECFAILLEEEACSDRDA